MGRNLRKLNNNKLKRKNIGESGWSVNNYQLQPGEELQLVHMAKMLDAYPEF